MRAVFVNHCHPDTPHVCAVRLREFANALARRGDQIVLLTGTLDGADNIYESDALSAALSHHDWSVPFRLACRPRRTPVTEALQAHRLPPGLSQAAVLWCYLVKAGVFWNWAEASREHWPILAGEFRPDVVWATFGNTDALNIACGIAQEAGCPWVIDIKDPWHHFIPAPLRAYLAKRYRSAAAMTSISNTHGEGAANCFPQNRTVIYSGFPERFVDTSKPGSDTGDGEFRLTLTGSVNDDQDLACVVGALAAFLDRIGPAVARQVTITYAGSDHARVEAALGPLSGRCEVAINRFIPLDELRQIQQGADLNLYIKSAAVPLHHKLLELLAIGKPILCYPEETPECLDIAGQVGGRFYNCRTAEEVGQFFDEAWRRCNEPAPQIDGEMLRFYSWEHQAGRLRDVLCG